MVLHNTLTANHVTYAGTFATESARLNATDLTTADIGKEYLQADNDTHWMLKAVSPSLIWVQTDPVLKPSTSADVTLYLDSVAGSDDNDGSQLKPLKTFTKAFRDILTKDIKDIVKIKVKAGTYTDFPSQPEPKLSGGRIIVDASGEIYPKLAGPFTINTVVGDGPAGPFGYSLATKLTVSPDPSWTVDQYYGKHIHMLTGNAAGKVFPIFENASADIITYINLYNIQATDTFEIVDCPVTIQLDHNVIIKTDTPNTKLYSLNQPNIIFAGIKFEIDTGSVYVPPLTFNDTSVVFTFCSLIDVYNADNESIPIFLNNSTVNFVPTPTNSLDNAELEDWYAYSFAILPLNGVAPTEGGIDIAIVGNQASEGIASLMCRRQIYSDSGDDNLQWLMCGGYTNLYHYQSATPSKGSVLLSHVYIKQIGYNKKAMVFSAKKAIVEAVYIAKSDLPLDVFDGAFCKVWWLKGTNINNAYALEIESMSNVFLPDVSTVTILGSTGAIKFIFDNTTHVAWPTSGNFYSKVNSFVVSK